ncbi:MAG TPA: hypothetical protein VF812_17270 [Ktedonobacterales bacterium]
MSSRTVAAVDLGAESGRVMLVRFDGQRLRLEEAHRFPNQPTTVLGHRFWDLFGLWNELLAGLRKARLEAGALDSLGVDTWGVDYGLLNAAGLLMSQPFHYRDHRTDGVMEQVFAQAPREIIYARTGYPVHADQHALPALRAQQTATRRAGARAPAAADSRRAA